MRNLIFSLVMLLMGCSATSQNLQLPKGGGAIRGMGEKFAANPVTGTGSVLENIYSGSASSVRYSRSLAPMVLGPEDLHRHG